MASAARDDLDIWPYLRDILDQLAAGARGLPPLLPDAWATTHPESVRAYRGREREAQATAKRERRKRRRALERAQARRR